jgi:pimeloyl-ACP methyl ester carboxylesterase
MSALFAATYPDRCWALVLFGTFASERPAPDYPWGETDEEFRAGLDELRSWGTPQNARALADVVAPTSSEEDRVALATLIRQSASPGRRRRAAANESRERCARNPRSDPSADPGAQPHR